MVKSELHPRDHYLNVALQAARKGGEVLKKYWGKLTHIKDKGIPGDLVTEADQESEEVILSLLKEHFPSHEILGEESGWHHTQNAHYCWFIDPLDGTVNYAHQNPMVNVSIGMFHHGQPLLGVVFNPFHDEMFHAFRGEGAFLNDERIHVSAIKTLDKSLLATGFAYDRRQTADNNYAEFCALTNITQGVRRAGAAALDLAYVAAGRLDGYWERGLKPWDMAAGMLLVEEAGGKVTGYNQAPVDIASGRILATNGLIHEMLSKTLLDTKKNNNDNG